MMSLKVVNNDGICSFHIQFFWGIQIPFSPLRGKNWNFMGNNSNSDTLTLIWYGSEGFF